MSKYLSLVIPTYNEAENISNSLEKAYKYLLKQDYKSEIIISDDESSDKTIEIVRKSIKEHKDIDIKLIQNSHRGKAQTVISGFKEAKGEIQLFSDADFSTPVSTISSVKEQFNNGYDVLIGSRAIGKRESEPFYRHIMGVVFNRIVKLVLLRGIKDTQCGFKAFRRSVIRDIIEHMRVHEPTTKRIKGPQVTGFDVEVLYIARKLGYKIKEIPVEWKYQETKRVNPAKDSYRLFRDVVKVRIFDLLGRYKW